MFMLSFLVDATYKCLTQGHMLEKGDLRGKKQAETG